MTQTSVPSVHPRGSTLADPWLFFTVTFGITWSLCLAAITLGLDFDSALGLVLLLAGPTGPGVAGIAFVCLVYEANKRDSSASMSSTRTPG